MKFPLRLLALVLTLSGGLTAAVAACPETAEDLGIDLWNISSLEEKCADEEQFDRTLDRECEQARRRIDIRQSVVADVLDGRQSLRDAAAVFVELNRSHPRVAAVARARFKGRSETEVAALPVIEQVKRSSDPRGEDVAAALTAELGRGLPG
jgi:hypothetical protein